MLKLYQAAIGNGLDISDDALEICKKNAQNQEVANRLTLKKSDLFAALSDKKFDLIISNPPYISSSDINNLQEEVKKFEPHLALDGGFDGLNFYRKIAKRAGEFLKDQGRVIVEIGYGQEKSVQEIFTAEKFIFEETKNDLAGIARALSFKIA